jgi:hypothetical protein
MKTMRIPLKTFKIQGLITENIESLELSEDKNFVIFNYKDIVKENVYLPELPDSDDSEYLPF